MTNREIQLNAGVPRYSKALANFLINTRPGRGIVLAGISATALAACGNSDSTQTATVENSQPTATAEATPTAQADSTEAKSTNEDTVINTAESSSLSAESIDLDGPLVVVEPNITQERYEHLANYYAEYEQSLGFKYLVGLHEAYNSGDLSRLNELGFSKRDIYMMYYVAALNQDSARDLHQTFVDTPLEFEEEVGSRVNSIATQMEYVVFVVPQLEDKGILDNLPENPTPYPSNDPPLQDVGTLGLLYPAASGIRDSVGLGEEESFITSLDKSLNRQEQDVIDLSSQGTDDDYTLGKIKTKELIVKIYKDAKALV